MFYATLIASDVAETTRYILVDESDGTNFGHTAGADLRLTSLNVHVDKEGTGDWIMRIGVVEEVDASNGSVKFFVTIPVRGISQVNQHIPFTAPHGRKGALNPDSVVATDDVSGSSNWQTDVDLTNPAGTSVGPGAGDIVIELEEVDGTATFSFAVTAEYDHAA